MILDVQLILNIIIWCWMILDVCWMGRSFDDFHVLFIGCSWELLRLKPWLAPAESLQPSIRGNCLFLGRWISRYPLVIYVTVCHGKWPIYRWFTYYKWWFSMATLNNQRVSSYTAILYNTAALKLIYQAARVLSRSNGWNMLKASFAPKTCYPCFTLQGPVQRSYSPFGCASHLVNPGAVVGGFEGRYLIG